MDIRNFGQKSIDEVKAKLAAWACAQGQPCRFRPGRRRAITYEEDDQCLRRGRAVLTACRGMRLSRVRRPAKRASDRGVRSCPRPLRVPASAARRHTSGTAGEPGHRAVRARSASPPPRPRPSAPSAGRAADHLRQARRPARPSPGADRHQRQVHRARAVHRDRPALSRTAPAATPASPRSARARATTPRWPSSSWSSRWPSRSSPRRRCHPSGREEVRTGEEEEGRRARGGSGRRCRCHAVARGRIDCRRHRRCRRCR